MNILIVDDHALFREGLRLMLERLVGDVQVLDASNAEEGLLLLQSNSALDLILLDLDLPGASGPDCVHRFRTESLHCPIFILSASEEQALIDRCLQAGADGFVHKSNGPQEMLNLIQKVLATSASGQYLEMQADISLTSRQREVLRELCKGKSNKEIARDLEMSDNTVRVHLYEVYRQLNVKTRTQAAMVAQRYGLN